MQKQLHLDSEYRRRWQEYHLADGSVFDSRQINWRQVEWEKVVKVVTYMNGIKHTVTCADKNSFLFFMCFRWGGKEPEYKNGKYVGHKDIKIWTMGWTDGQRCFLMDIDFYTGNEIKRYETPLARFKHHIHPRIKNIFNRSMTCL